jgi:hypothetical protein
LLSISSRRDGNPKVGAAGQIEAFFDGHRHSRQRTELLAACDRFINVFSGLARALRQIGGDGIELAVDGLEPRNKVLDDRGGRELARGNAGRDLARG